MNLVTRIIAALDGPPPSDLLIGDLIEGEDTLGSPAAVLVAITDRPSPGVILTQRHVNLRTHAGQVAFPGGRIDDGETAREAALREAEEELALDRAHVRIIGEADPYRTVTGFAVSPIVALVPPGLVLVPNPLEVDDWFEAPLDFVLDPINQHRMTAEYQGRMRHYYQINWLGRRIWGATAAMLVNLSRRIA